MSWYDLLTPKGLGTYMNRALTSNSNTLKQAEQQLQKAQAQLNQRLRALDPTAPNYQQHWYDQIRNLQEEQNTLDKWAQQAQGSYHYGSMMRSAAQPSEDTLLIVKVLTLLFGDAPETIQQELKKLGDMGY